MAADANSPSPDLARPDPPRLRRWVGVVLAGMFVFALAARIAGPSDLYDNEQPKTVAYTMDIVVHGRAIMPYDMKGRAPHKPPLYNWLAVPVVGGLGVYEQWAFALPSVG